MGGRWYLGGLGGRLRGRNLSFPMRCVFERSFTTAAASCFWVCAAASCRLWLAAVTAKIFSWFLEFFGGRDGLFRGRLWRVD